LPLIIACQYCKDADAFWLLPYLWSWSCHLLWQQGKCHILKWKHWWILMLFNKWWTLLQQCTFNLLTRINLTTQQNYLSIVHYVIPLPYKSWLSVSSQPCNLIGLKRPLHPAWIQGKLPIIPFLLQHNLDAVQHHDNCNRVPLHYASNNLAKKQKCFDNLSTNGKNHATILHWTDLTDSGNSRYAIEEKEEGNNQFDDDNWFKKGRTNNQCYILYFSIILYFKNT